MLTSISQEYYKLPGCEEAADADDALHITSRRIMAELSENDLIEDYDEDNDEQQVISSIFGRKSDSKSSTALQCTNVLDCRHHG
jgi:hypothetical protein